MSGRRALSPDRDPDDLALPYLDLVDAVFGQVGLIIATLMDITATYSTVNTILAAVPRMISGMADHVQACAIMGKMHPRYNTPWVSIVFLAKASR